MAYQKQSSFEGLFVANEFSLAHIVSFPAQRLRVGFEFPEAVDGL